MQVLPRCRTEQSIPHKALIVGVLQDQQALSPARSLGTPPRLGQAIWVL